MLLSCTMYASFVIVMESDNHVKQLGLDDGTPMASQSSWQRDVKLPVSWPHYASVHYNLSATWTISEYSHQWGWLRDGGLIDRRSWIKHLAAKLWVVFCWCFTHISWVTQKLGANWSKIAYAECINVIYSNVGYYILHIHSPVLSFYNLLTFTVYYLCFSVTTHWNMSSRIFEMLLFPVQIGCRVAGETMTPSSFCCNLSWQIVWHSMLFRYIDQ